MPTRPITRTDSHRFVLEPSAGLRPSLSSVCLLRQQVDVILSWPMRWMAIGWLIWLATCLSPAAAREESDHKNQGWTPTDKPRLLFQEIPSATRKSVPQSLDDLRAIEHRVESLVPNILKSVVAVTIGASSGSGVIISPDGYVLTAAHVSDRAGRDARFVLPDGRTLRGRTLGANHQIDAGLMKITEEGPWPHVAMAQVGDSRLGDWVLTMGHPGGFEPGRAPVVRLGRIIRLPSPMIQTDCTITAGDSGGPLFDLRGAVVGIHSRISDSPTANFHAPVDAFSRDWERLLKGERWGEETPPERPSIGARGKDHPEGCQLELVEPDSTAARAGIRVGDIIHRINGQILEGSDSFRQRLRECRIGESIRLEIRRGDQTFQTSVVVAARKPRP